MKWIYSYSGSGVQYEYDDGLLEPMIYCVCPCCHYMTPTKRGYKDIFAVCYWEDDGQDDIDADEVRGGPNYTLGLTDARRNFLKIGACEERMLEHVRAPTEDELNHVPHLRQFE